MAQLLNIPGDKKYKIDTLTLLDVFTDKVKDEESLLNMFRFQIYSSLVQHSDFHAKNVSILDAGKEKYILAPLYDIISVGVYNGKEFVEIEIKPEMIGRRLGEFAPTTKKPEHSAPGVGASKSTKHLHVK
jgi:ribosomal protein uS19